jgi:hypothetical protein
MNIFERLISKVSDELAGLDDTVRERIPGGWTLPALLAGGYYFAPEISAFFNPTTGATVAAAEVAGGEAAINAALTSGGLTGTNALAGAEALSAIPTNFLAPSASAGAGAMSTNVPGLLGASMEAGTFAAPSTASSLMSYLPSASTALTAGSALLGAVGSAGAARAMSNANQGIGDVNYRIFQEQKALQEPWRAAGEEALNKLRSPEMQFTPFSADKFQADPGYAFRLSEGIKGLNNAAAARGGLLSGGTLKATQRFAQGLASQEYQNAYDRYNTDYRMKLSPLQTLAGYGQTSTNNLTNTTGTYGANQAENIATGGNIRASSYLNAADALARGASQYLRNESDNALIAALRRS